MNLIFWAQAKQVFPVSVSVPVPELQPLNARDIIKHRRAAAVKAGEYPWYAPEVLFLDCEHMWLKPRPVCDDVPDMMVFSDDE